MFRPEDRLSDTLYLLGLRGALVDIMGARYFSTEPADSRAALRSSFFKIE
jgi:hypothetical protein